MKFPCTFCTGNYDYLWAKLRKYGRLQHLLDEFSTEKRQHMLAFVRVARGATADVLYRLPRKCPWQLYNCQRDCTMYCGNILFQVKNTKVFAICMTDSCGQMCHKLWQQKAKIWQNRTIITMSWGVKTYLHNKNMKVFAKYMTDSCVHTPFTP